LKIPVPINGKYPVFVMDIRKPIGFYLHAFLRGGEGRDGRG
jgi:hypothetical protein